MADDSKRPELLRLSDGSIGRFGLDCLIVAGNPKVSRAGSLPPDTGSLSAKRRRMTCRSSKNRISIYIYIYIHLHLLYISMFFLGKNQRDGRSRHIPTRLIIRAE